MKIITIKADDKQAPVPLTTSRGCSVLKAFMRLGVSLGKLEALAEYNARQIQEMLRHA